MSNYNLEAIIRVRDMFTSPLSSFREQISQARQSAENASGGFKNFNNSLDEVGKKSNGVSGILKKVSGVFAGIGIAKFVKDSLMMASDLTEVQNVVDTTFGGSADVINNFSKTTSAQFGISELQAKKYSGTLGAMLKSAGYTGTQLADMSTSLTGLAGDMASFYNLNPDEAFEKLKAGISGETEPLKSLGVDISDTTVASYAMANGFTKQWSTATQAEKELWRYKAIMNQTKDAQGDYSKTSDSFANQLRTLKLNFESLGSKIMGTSIPAFQALFGKINNFITNIDVNAIVDKIQSTMESLAPFGNAILDTLGNVVNFVKNNFSTIMPVVAGVASAFVAFNSITKVITIFNGLSKVVSVIKTVIFAIQAFVGGAGTIGECLALISNPIGLAVAAIGLLVGAFVLAWNKSEAFRTTVTNAIQGVRDTFTDVVAIIKNKIDEFKAKLDENKEAVALIMSVLNAIFQTGVAALGAIFETLAVTISDVISNIGTIFGGIVDVISGIIEIIQGIATGDWSKVWEGIKDVVSGTIDIIKGLWHGLVDLLSTPVRAVVNVTKKVFGGKSDSGEQTETEDGNNYTGTSNWKGGWTAVNERGYEVMNLPSGSSIINHQGSEALLDKIANSSSNNTRDIHVHMEGSVFNKEADMDTFIDKFVSTIKKETLKMA